MLGERKRLKRKKPTFMRFDAHKVKRIKKSWRMPHGRHSAVRKKRKGRVRQPSIGWSSPKEVRGLTREGYPVVIVHNVAGVVAAKGPVMIAASVGARKRVAMVKKASELKYPILNVKDPQGFVKRVEEEIQSRKKLKSAKEEKKKHVTVEAEKKAKAEKELTPEEREKIDREEKRKVLEQR